MAPPTVANGRVYLASFGTENVGTGQLCVYGLLSDGPPPDAPVNVHASTQGRFVSIKWSYVLSATSYTVERVQGDHSKVIGSGLTLPEFTYPASDQGVAKYVVMSVNANGQSARSAAANADVETIPFPRHRH
jgi:hypothetical protein